MPKKKSKSLPKKNENFFVVTVGASAGGLDAFKEFLKHIPAKSDIAFVFIQHLSPKHKSLLPEILSRITPMSVRQVVSGTKVMPNCLYVIPPGATMFLKGGKFYLTARLPEEKPHHPIDRFMESAAYDLGHRAIGVVLSGTGSDGAEGTRIIKAEGGISFAQNPDSAAYDSMPTKAILIDHIDFILDPKEMALEILNISKLPAKRLLESKNEVSQEEIADFTRILTMLKQNSGTDYNQYKPTTIKRRIARRILVHKLENMGEYSKYLQTHPPERSALNDDILINVTSFFRDPETYANLKSHILPAILKNKTSGQSLRIWSAGCSTGEEAYSIAMCVMEVMGAEANPSTVQIFATDLSEKCIEKARIGKFHENITEHVFKERLNKFFTKTETGFIIAKHVRDLCIFAKHDLTRDPAYSKLDLISCKNLLIYLGQDLQTKVLENFHYSLNPNGYLSLGNSESVGKSTDIYSVVDSKLKVYSKKSVASKFNTPAAGRRDYPVIDLNTSKSKIVDSNTGPSGHEIQIETDRAILSRYAPPCVVINTKNEIVQFRGATDHFLVHKHGEASLNIFRMAREGLVTELKNAITKARQKDSSVRAENIQLMDVGAVNFEVIPLKFLPGDRCLLIVFDVVPQVPALKGQSKKKSKGKASAGQYDSMVVGQLRLELSSVKDNLQAMIQDFENANQELQSANEEVLSSNEELQSTNEELETSKEELQSSNEELSTVNDELQERNLELFRTNNDLLNVLNSVQLPILIVGNDLTIRRYTAATSKVFNLIPTDIGRPFAHISSNVFNVTEIQTLITDVLENAVVKEKEILTKNKKWFHVRIRPYKTEENKIEGAVISLQENTDVKSFVDVTKVLIDMVGNPFLLLDRDLKVATANDNFYTEFKLKPKSVEQFLLSDIAKNFGSQKLKNILLTVSKSIKDEIYETLELDSGRGKKSYSIGVKRIADDPRLPTQFLVIFEPVTKKK